MSFSFDEDLADDLSKVRFEIGDVLDDSHQVEDEAIEALLVTHSNSVIKVARQLARHLWAKYAYEVTRQADGFGSVGAKEFLTDRATHWRRIYESLKAEARGNQAVGFFGGGIEVAENLRQAEDTSLAKPQFGVGQFDNAMADQPDSQSRPDNEETEV